MCCSTSSLRLCLSLSPFPSWYFKKKKSQTAWQFSSKKRKALKSGSGSPHSRGQSTRSSSVLGAVSLISGVRYTASKKKCWNSSQCWLETLKELTSPPSGKDTINLRLTPSSWGRFPQTLFFHVTRAVRRRRGVLCSLCQQGRGLTTKLIRDILTREIPTSGEGTVPRLSLRWVPSDGRGTGMPVVVFSS